MRKTYLLVNPPISRQHHDYNIVSSNSSNMQRRVAILVLLVHQVSKAAQLHHLSDSVGLAVGDSHMESCSVI